MNLLHPKALVPALALSAMASAALAHGYNAGNLAIQHPWSRETAAGQGEGGGFLTIANRGAREDRLVSATTPVAADVQLHTVTMDGGIMRMRQVSGGIAIPARGSVELRPGGYHIMFMGLRRQLRRGERFPVTLQFQHAGNVAVQFAVQPVTSTSPIESGHAGH